VLHCHYLLNRGWDRIQRRCDELLKDPWWVCTARASTAYRAQQILSGLDHNDRSLGPGDALVTPAFSFNSSSEWGSVPHVLLFREVISGVRASDCYLQKKLWIWLSDLGPAIINIVIGHLSVLWPAAWGPQEAPRPSLWAPNTSLINLSLTTLPALPTELITSSFRAAAPSPAGCCVFPQEHPGAGLYTPPNRRGADLLYITLLAKLVCHVNQSAAAPATTKTPVRGRIHYYLFNWKRCVIKTAYDQHHEYVWGGASPRLTVQRVWESRPSVDTRASPQMRYCVSWLYAHINNGWMRNDHLIIGGSLLVSKWAIFLGPSVGAVACKTHTDTMLFWLPLFGETPAPRVLSAEFTGESVLLPPQLTNRSPLNLETISEFPRGNLTSGLAPPSDKPPFDQFSH